MTAVKSFKTSVPEEAGKTLHWMKEKKLILIINSTCLIIEHFTRNGTFTRTRLSFKTLNKGCGYYGVRLALGITRTKTRL